MASIALKRPVDTARLAGLTGNAFARPLLDRGGESLVKGLLRQVEAAEQTDQRGEDAARFGIGRRITASLAWSARARS
jgi:hypothetical protein